MENRKKFLILTLLTISHLIESPTVNSITTKIQDGREAIYDEAYSTEYSSGKVNQDATANDQTITSSMEHFLSTRVHPRDIIDPLDDEKSSIEYSDGRVKPGYYSLWSANENIN